MASQFRKTYTGTAASVYRTISVASILCFLLVGVVSGQSSPEPPWRAGVAENVITPEKHIWMGGYGGRDHPAKGKIHDLFVKALALQDSTGHRAVIITTDLLAIPRYLSDRIRNELGDRLGLDRSQILINASHTHSGPVLHGALMDIYPDDQSVTKPIREYTETVDDTIVATAVAAFEDMWPARVRVGEGFTRFAIHRRNNEAEELETATEIVGPSDYSVPVIAVRDADRTVRAIVFGYACHATTTGGYKWSGDYPGFAQRTLEKYYPESTALFVAGAAGDQNPYPRGTVPLTRQHGTELASAVRRVLQEEMKEVEPRLITRYTEIALDFSTLPSRKDLQHVVETESGYHVQWAERMLKKIEDGDERATQYPYPMQVWRFGDYPLVALGGEVVVRYAIQIKRLLGPNTFVAGYSNDVMAYIPTVYALREGGYEGRISMQVYGQPSTWRPEVEHRILSEVIDLFEEAGGTLPEEELD